MKNKFYSPLMLLTIIIISFPSICFSELKTVDGEYCDVYLGDLKNKKELEDFRKTVRTNSIENGLGKLTTPKSALYLLYKTLEGQFPDKCISHVISNYLEKVVVVSHTENDRKICDKVKITFNPEVINKYLNQEICKTTSYASYERFMDDPWYDQVDYVLTKKTEKINIGLIIETKIPGLEVSKREQLENKQEKEFFNMTERDKGKYRVIDRRHLKNILEEQKLSMTGLTDSDTVKLGKILNLDIIVLRLIYEGSQVTKVLKVDTGEVLLFKTWETYKETKKEGWIYYGRTEDGDWYYDNSSIMKVSPNIIRVWNKLIFTKDWKEKNKDFIQNIIEQKLSKGDYNKLHHRITLDEIDCLKNTWKYMKYVDYSDEGESLLDYDYLPPEIRLIIPETIKDVLRRKVCE